jgi:hypothetical protein
VHALVELPDQDEQPTGGEAVDDHLHHHALQRQLVPGVDAEQDEAEVGDAGVRDQALQVGLGERDHGPVEDADDAERHRHGAKAADASGKSGTAKRIRP